MLSTTWITFAPGWRCTFRMIAGVPSTHRAELGVLRTLHDGGDVGHIGPSPRGRSCTRR
jgi:hypothetical protein